MLIKMKQMSILKHMEKICEVIYKITSIFNCRYLQMESSNHPNRDLFFIRFKLKQLNVHHILNEFNLGVNITDLNHWIINLFSWHSIDFQNLVDLSNFKSELIGFFFHRNFSLQMSKIFSIKIKTVFNNADTFQLHLYILLRNPKLTTIIN
jgi:hypothetical protein